MSDAESGILLCAILLWAAVVPCVWIERSLRSDDRYGQYGKDAITNAWDFIGALFWPVTMVCALVRDARRRLRTPRS